MAGPPNKLEKPKHNKARAHGKKSQALLGEGAESDDAAFNGLLLDGTIGLLMIFGLMLLCVAIFCVSCERRYRRCYDKLSQHSAHKAVRTSTSSKAQRSRRPRRPRGASRLAAHDYESEKMVLGRVEVDGEEFAVL